VRSSSLLERALVLAVVVTLVVVVSMVSLLFFAVSRMERLKSFKVSVKFTPLPVISFEASADGEVKELPPGGGS
jgi:hypothetical protein